jgi:glycogen(starch) synthase
MVVTNCDEARASRQENFQGTEIRRFAFYETLNRSDLPAFRRVFEECENAINAFEPDLIHLNVCSKGLLSFALWQRKHRLPFVMTLHDRNIYKNPNALSREVFAASSAIVAISDFIHRDALESMPELRWQLRTILNALPGPHEKPASFPSEPRLLAVGRLVQEKGFDIAIEAFARIKDEFPGASLTIAGDGELRAELVELAATLGVRDRVEFLGWQHPDGINDLISRHSLVIMPSRWLEPFGLVALQAAQMGRPVCASNCGGLPEIVLDGVTGLLFEKENAQDLARILGKLLREPEQLQAMGQRAQEHALKHFGFSDFVAAYESVFREALEQPL